MNWDLLVLNPIVIFAALGIIAFMLIYEKVSGKLMIFLLEVFFFWFAAGIMTKEVVNQYNIISVKNINDFEFTALVVLSTYFFGAILKPLATYFTGRWKSRRSWIYAGNIFSIIGAILMIVAKSWDFHLSIYIILVLLLAFILSVSSLHYLFLNEQYYYRINPTGVTWIVFTVLTLGTFAGSYANNLAATYMDVDSSYAMPIIMLVAFIIATSLSFVKKESKSLVGSFDEMIREQLPKKDPGAYVVIAVVSLLVSATNAVTTSNSTNIFVTVLLAKDGYSVEQMRVLLRFYAQIAIWPSIICGYLLFTFVFEKVGYKYTILTNLFALFLIYTIEAFTHDAIIYMILQFFQGIVYAQITFYIFSLAIMWNYRAPNVPVTGYAAGATVLGKYIVDTGESLAVKFSHGTMHELGSPERILANQDGILDRLLADPKYFENGMNDIVTLLFSMAAIIVLIGVLTFYFTSQRVLVDFAKYRKAMNNLKSLIRKGVMDRAKTAISIDDINNYSSIGEV